MTLLRYHDAAKRLAIGDRTLDTLISRGEIATVRVARGARRISDAEIDRYIREHTSALPSVVDLASRRTR